MIVWINLVIFNLFIDLIIFSISFLQKLISYRENERTDKLCVRKIQILEIMEHNWTQRYRGSFIKFELYSGSDSELCSY